jgi:dipeptidyl aminopeptidase/acylaminoacyl peptidase
LVALGSAAALAAVGAAPATAAPLSGNIAFASNALAPAHSDQTRYRIAVMNTEGVGVTLNPNPAGAYDDMDPAWSPDGRRIAFASNRSGNFDIYVMNANGTDVKRLTSEPRGDRYPAWSPNGALIAFRGYAGPSGGSQIFTMAPDGTGAKALPHTFGGDQPSWAPDGHRIAFTDTTVSTNQVLEIVDTATGGAAPLTSGTSAMDRYPAWSPDGGEIAFRRFDPTGQGREVWMVSPSGGTAVNLSTVLGAPARSASWSPDGHNLVFVSYRDADHNQEIWLGSRTGATPARQLTFTTWDNDEPRWADVPAGASPVPPATGKPGGGTVGGGVAPGTGRASLSLSLRVPRQGLGHRTTLRARVRCNQRCRIVIGGSAKRKGHGGKAVALRRTRRTLSASHWTRIKVNLGNRALRSIRASLRHHRRVRVTLSASARTTSGAFTPAVVRRITLKR